MSVQQTEIVDLVALSPDQTTVQLVMVEERPWEGDQQLYELQEKVNTYADYALGGGLLQDYPIAIGKRVRLELRCVYLPTDAGRELLERIREALRPHELELVVDRIRDSGAG
jgi:hypothetical protein